ncbi:MAG: 4Fe-4S dicluster domain-containing protein [Conexivisphaerales archaeon]|nr:4Fe-4S dicluster domain-containing protein [Conexivisphaerales archaeon]
MSSQPVGVQYAILFDVTRCTGCRACQIACKNWWDLPADETTFNPGWANPPDLTPYTWLLVRYYEEATGSGLQLRFPQTRCMHCDDPACVHACPVGAITKYDEGPVVIDEDKCIGCKYCIDACPFDVPRYDVATNKVYKCNMCVDRVSAGLEPACVETCPSDALQFGVKGDMLEKAKARAAAMGGGYVYGEKEAGGTSVFIVTDRPPEDYGYPSVAPQLPEFIDVEDYTKLGGTAVGLAVVGLLAGISFVANRRERLAKDGKAGPEEAKKGGDGD